MACLVKSAHRRGFLLHYQTIIILYEEWLCSAGFFGPGSFKTDRSRGAPVPDPQHRGEAAETDESDALRRVRDSGEKEQSAGLNSMPLPNKSEAR
jgi:hypothetical protein